MPVVYVSHSLAEVARLATTIVVLDRGTVKRAGSTTDILSDPDAVPDAESTGAVKVASCA